VLLSYVSELVYCYDRYLLRITSYQPDKVQEVDGLLVKIGGVEKKMDQLMKLLVEKYGPEPGTSSDPKRLRQRVAAFYEHYDSSKVCMVDDLVKRTKLKAAYEMRLMQMLIRKYGEEPVADESDKNPSSSDEEDDYDFCTRLTRFYAKYAPEKVDDVSKLVEKTQGVYENEEKLMAMLREKYGEEPETEDEVEEQVEEQVEEEQVDENESSLLRQVLYCPTDGFPPEYSEYLDSFSHALPWLYANCPELVLTSKKKKTVEEYVASLENKEEIEMASHNSKRGGAGRPNKQLKKSGKKIDSFVTVERSQRQKRKFVTSVVGLDTFDIKLKEAAKKLGKKLACGASINKLPNGMQSIDIQGDYMYELPEIILEYYPDIPKAKISVISEGKKSPAF